MVLTRVMTDDDRGVEIAQLQSVLERIQSALRDVPLAQREYIAADRKAGRTTDPFYWAAFVASGTGTGLDSK